MLTDEQIEQKQTMDVEIENKMLKRKIRSLNSRLNDMVDEYDIVTRRLSYVSFSIENNLSHPKTETQYKKSDTATLMFSLDMNMQT
jgi:hypothetical protein